MANFIYPVLAANFIYPVLAANFIYPVLAANFGLSCASRLTLVYPVGWWLTLFILR